MKFLVLILVSCMFFSCADSNKPIEVEISHLASNTIVGQNTVFSRFLPPAGYIREPLDSNSFRSYLRNFELLPSGNKVRLYDGTLKQNQSAHAAILDIDVGTTDLQQCADAIMRLRAEYLWQQNRFEDIAFDFTNGWRFEYAEWRAGNSLHVAGNKTKWIHGSEPKDSYAEFRKYLNQVFMYAGTASLSKELRPKSISDIEIGDVFIKGGFPGHAVIVMDKCKNKDTEGIAVLLAQSYMPAQQIHILKNPLSKLESPWYFISDLEKDIVTPEWTFSIDELKEF